MNREDRLEEGLRDRKEANVIIEWIKQHRKYFDYSDTNQSLLEEKKDDDLLLLQDAFMGWIGNAKIGAEKKRELTLLLQSLWRVQNYCGSMEIVCKAGTAKVIEIEKRFNDFKSQLKTEELNHDQERIRLESEIKVLKKQIEFLSK